MQRKVTTIRGLAASIVRFLLSASLLFTSFASAQSTISPPAAGEPAPGADSWHFAVSGDSRNCGDVVMPAIAAGAIRDHAIFYWHLGDLRWIANVDQDFAQLNGEKWSFLHILYYEHHAWDDFIQNQISPFGSLPFYLGIGNHETVLPKTRGEFVERFTDWLDAPPIREQRLQDSPADHQVRTYYHWTQGGIDFINLDNATDDQFDEAQMKWVGALLTRDAANPAVLAVVVGMHEALPDSIASSHSMSHWGRGQITGRQVYQELLSLRNAAHKNVYILASHSHFFMDGAFNTSYLREHGGVLPGWIIGTAGAVRYRLPANAKDAKAATTDVYGYLLATVNPPGAARGTVRFDFKQLDENAIPSLVVTRFTPVFVHECFEHNRQ